MKEIFENKTVFITGGCGSIGSEIVRQVLKCNPKQVRVYDYRETELFHLQEELKEHKALRVLIGDIRDRERLFYAMQDVDIVFHAAALKHVPLCEYNPFEAMKTNVEGTQNVVDACLKNNVDKLINISTDKVVNAINTMGATKLLAERLVNAGEYYKGHKRTKFASVRFGNVVGSRGSVIDLFKKQLEQGKPLTVTDPEMTRFIMSIPEAVKLVIKAAQIMLGGEVFILKMPSFRLGDLVDIVIDHVGSKDTSIKLIGLRPGEKMHEELMIEGESVHSYETDELLILQNAICTPYHGSKECKSYSGAQMLNGGNSYISNGDDLMAKEKLLAVLLDKKVL